MSEQQVLNYLHWLRERGQYFFVPAVTPETFNAECARETPVAERAPEVKTATSAAPLKVIFVSLRPLDNAEDEMVSRIAAALDLKSDDFAIAAGDSVHEHLRTQLKVQIVAMGDEARHLIDGGTQIPLLIPHPSAMLSEPRLKVSAWATLQKIKMSSES